jgi:hypothetical protein
VYLMFFCRILTRVWRLPLSCSVLLFTLSMLVVSTAFAAQKADWWVYVGNDRAREIQQLLAQGADPNQRSQNGQPTLMRAVVAGAWQVFDVIAADPRSALNVQNPAQETPLMYLALVGQTERARDLIARGAEVNRPGWTPLHYAASKGQLDLARLLLQHEALVNARSPDGVTPLMMAAYSRRRDMVQLLLDAGADPSLRDQREQDAVDWALRAKAFALAESLRQLMARRAQSQQKNAPLAESIPSALDSASSPRAQQSTAVPSTATRPTVSGVLGLSLHNYEAGPLVP